MALADKSPNFKDVIKDIGEIHRRLFDHRPFLQGEAQFFLKEFEEKRNDREVQHLFDVLENVTEIRETQLEKGCKLGDMHLCNMTINLEVALSMCNKILERENDNSDELLKARRNKRHQEWEAFMADIADKHTRVDQTFAEKEQQLHTYYQELEEKLRISPSHHAQQTSLK